MPLIPYGTGTGLEGGVVALEVCKCYEWNPMGGIFFLF